MKAKSIKGKNAVAIDEAIQTATADGFTPTLAIVFLSAENELEGVIKSLSQKNITIFGNSSGDGFIDGKIETDSIIVLLIEMKPDYFTLLLKSTNGSSTIDISKEIARSGLDKYSKPGFMIVSAGLKTDGDDIVEGIEQICGKGTTIFGGLAADKLKMERTFIFTNDAYSEDGVLALIIDEDKITLNGMAVGGWKPMGMERTITKSNGNVVYSIDNEPALDFISRYSGYKEIDPENALNFILSSNFQLQLKRENKHPVMRTPMQANKQDRSIIFAGSLPEGSKVRLSLLPGFEVIEAAIDEFTQYKKVQPEADALIMFSCAGRQLSLGPYVSQEINRIQKIWEVPMAGFFCFGEIGRVSGGLHEFHNMTCSLAILKEKTQ